MTDKVSEQVKRADGLTELRVDEKWSILFDSTNNDRPVRVLRYGEPKGSLPSQNVVTAMFYALLTRPDMERAASPDGLVEAVEPVAWQYEEQDRKEVFHPRLSSFKPDANSPRIRNVAPLYTHPTPTGASSALAGELEAAIAACDESACGQFGASGDALNAVYDAARKCAAAFHQPEADKALLRDIADKVRDPDGAGTLPTDLMARIYDRLGEA